MSSKRKPIASSVSFNLISNYFQHGKGTSRGRDGGGRRDFGDRDRRGYGGGGRFGDRDRERDRGYRGGGGRFDGGYSR